MKLKIKAQVNHANEIGELIKFVSEIEKGHSCNCTLLEIEITPTPLAYQERGGLPLTNRSTVPIVLNIDSKEIARLLPYPSITNRDTSEATPKLPSC